MTKKTLSLAVILLLGMTTAQADDYPYLMFQTTDGSTTAVAAADLTITFSDGKLLATNVDGSKTFTLTDLSKMFFSATGDASGIDEVQDSGLQTNNGPVEVFTLAGFSLGNYETLEQAKRALSPGIYLLKSGSRTIKIAVK